MLVQIACFLTTRSSTPIPLNLRLRHFGYNSADPLYRQLLTYVLPFLLVLTCPIQKGYMLCVFLLLLFALRQLLCNRVLMTTNAMHVLAPLSIAASLRRPLLLRLSISASSLAHLPRRFELFRSNVTKIV